MRSSRLWVLAGSAVVVVGVAMVIASHAWSAYGPFSDDAITLTLTAGSASGEAPAVADARQMWAGMALVVVGLLAIAIGIGYRFGLVKGLAQREA